MSDETTTTSAPEVEQVSAPAELGDAGKQALDRMKGERNAARAEAKAWADLGITPDQARELLTKQQETSSNAALDAAVRDAVKAERDGFSSRVRDMAVREQAAALGFHDVADALQADLDGITVADDFSIDADAVKAALDALVQSKPYLVKAATADHRTAGVGAVGGNSVSLDASAAELLRLGYSS